MRNLFVLDTNILVYFFDGNKSCGKLLSTIEYTVSSVSYIELLSDVKTPLAKRELISEFLSNTTVIQTSPPICDFAAKFRLTYNIKTPDAIIAATAKYSGIPLITADASFFKIKEIEIIKFSK